MKKTQYIELFATIKKTMVSFVSIVFFVLLSVAIFLGMDWSVTGFKNTVDNTLKQWNMHDVALTFPYGFSDEIINNVKELDYIDKVEGQNSFEANFSFGDNRYQAKVILLTDQLDDAHKIEGRIPRKKGEIGFERFWAEKNGINVGDTIVFDHDDDGTAYSIYNLLNEDIDALQENKKTEDGMLYLTTDTFEVTGLFENATYINQYKVTYGASATTSIPNDCITYVSDDSIDLKAFNGYRTLLITSNELTGINTFDNKYKEKSNEIIDRLQIDLKEYIDATNNKVRIAINNVKADLDLKIKEGEQELIKAEKSIVDGEKEIKDGEKQIADGKIELANAKIELADAKEQLDAGWAEYNTGFAEYSAGIQQVNQIVDIYDGLMKAIDVYKAIENAPSILDSFYESYISGSSTAKEIIESLDAETKNIIEQFFLDYKNNVYDGSVTNLATTIKNIVNSTGYEELKTLLVDADKTDGSVEALIDIIDFFDSVNEDIDKTLLLYQLSKMDVIASVLESEVIDIAETEKTKLVNVLDYINNSVDASYSDAQIIAYVISAITSQYDSTIDNVKASLEQLKTNKIDPALAQLSIAKSQLDVGYSQLAYGQRQYDTGLAKYEKGLVEIEENKKLIAQAKIDLVNGKKKLEEGKEELAIAKSKAKDFDKKISEIELYDITLLGRNLNASVGSAIVPTEILGSLKYTMALLFVIVGVFVCYSALSRSVYDQTIQIGTKKALGLSRREIVISFLMYGTFAVIVGCVLGTLAARFIVEPIILFIFAKNYIVADNQYYFSMSSSLLFLLFELVITNSTSYIACNKVLNKKAIKLLQGPEDLIGKSHFYEKLPGWNSLSLLTKTIINNCVNDKRRVLATLVGVAGCCSLMVCAISLVTNMNDSLDYQLNNVTKFDSVVYYNSFVEDAFDNISNSLNEKDIEHLTTTYSSCAIENSAGDYVSGALFVFDNDDFDNFFGAAIDGAKQKMGDGICVAKAYAQYNNVNVGDYVVILDSVGKKHSIQVSAIFDYYLLRAQTIMSSDTFSKVFDNSPVKNAFLVKCGDYHNSDINNILKSIDGYITTFDYIEESRTLYSSLTDSIMVVVITFFVLAVILAFLVILNLLIMFVDEKKKELIVMMINGYSRKRVKTYIYGDTIVLTVIGIIIGIIVGVIAGFATIKTFDSDCVTIMRNINIPSYLLCGTLTTLFSAISCLIALRKVDQFKLTDINSK